MGKNRVKMNIAGSSYVIVSDETEAYTKSIGQEIDNKMSNLMRNNPDLSAMKAAVLIAFDYCDKARKESDSSENLRNQIKVSFETSAKVQFELEKLKEDNDKLKKALTKLKTENKKS